MHRCSCVSGVTTFVCVHTMEEQREKDDGNERNGIDKDRTIEYNREKPKGEGSRSLGISRAVPRPEAARHLGHPYIAKYSPVEKTLLVPEAIFLDTTDKTTFRKSCRSRLCSLINSSDLTRPTMGACPRFYTDFKSL